MKKTLSGEMTAATEEEERKRGLNYYFDYCSLVVVILLYSQLGC